MQLRLARLCLDCEEVHDEYRCPVCASEHFSFLTRWVPAPERRSRPRPPAPPPPEVDVYRRMLDAGDPPRRGRLLSRALVGLGAAGVLGLFIGGRQARGQGQASLRPSDRTPSPNANDAREVDNG